MNTYSKKTETEQCTIPVVRRSFSHTKVNLRNEDIVGMISTYEFLVWNNEAEDKKHCQRVLRKLKKAINYANVTQVGLVLLRIKNNNNMEEYKLNEMEQAIFDVLKDWNLKCSEDDDLKQELARQIEKEVIKLNEPAVSKCDSIERRNLLIDFGNQVVEIQNRYHCILQDVEKEVDAYLKSINNC